MDFKTEQPISGYNGNPQVEDGFIRIANELFDAILSFGFSKRQIHVLLAIIRKTYGYQKTSDDISLSQIAELTKIAIPNISSTLKELEVLKVIHRSKGKYGDNLSINKYYDQWCYQNDNVIETSIIKTITNYYQNDNEVLSKQSQGIIKTINTKDNTKRQYQKTIPKESSNRASRLTADWKPSDVEIEFCKTTRPDLNVLDIADQFRDYWVSQPGAKGRKLDWTATWRNWVRNQRKGFNQGLSKQAALEEHNRTVANNWIPPEMRGITNES